MSEDEIKERQARSLQDPEIQGILKDPLMQSILNDLQVSLCNAFWCSQPRVQACELVKEVLQQSNVTDWEVGW